MFDSATQISELLKGLNDRQREAVTHEGGPLLIVAGAGTGKTRVIAHRMAYLIATGRVRPDRLVAVTFTNRAAAELKSRVEALVGDRAGSLIVGTFHWFGNRFLRRYGSQSSLGSNFRLLTPRESSLVLRSLIRSLDLGPVPPSPLEVREAVSNFRNGGRSRNFGAISIEEIAREYERRLHAQGTLDLDDLVLQPVRLLREKDDLRQHVQRRFGHVLVDEYQDVNKPQQELVHLISGRSGLTAVGDEDQSIYTWRQADAGSMLHFEDNFPGTSMVRLEQNYRSTKRILRASNALVRNNHQRLGKNLFTEGDSGGFPVVFAAGDEFEEASFVADAITGLLRKGTVESEIAVLHRINALSRVIEEALVRSGIPYSIRGGRRFYERPEVARIIDGLRVTSNLEHPASWQSFLRWIPGIADRRAATAVMAAKHEDRVSLTKLVAGVTGVSKATQDAIGEAVERMEAASRETDPALQARSMARLVEDLAGPIGSTPLEVEAEAANVEEFLVAVAEFQAEYAGTLREFLDRVSLSEPKEHGNGVQLMTLHAAKGLEFDAVFITGVEEGLMPHSRTVGSSSSNLEEERRLLYVGMTRARRALYLSYSHSRTIGGRHGPTGPSRFLQEIPRQLIEVAHGPKKAARLRLPFVAVGDRVRHARWGEGIVERVEGNGHGTMVSILFVDGTRQRVQLCHAPLQRMVKGAP